MQFLSWVPAPAAGRKVTLRAPPHPTLPNCAEVILCCDSQGLCRDAQTGSPVCRIRPSRAHAAPTPRAAVGSVCLTCPCKQTLSSFGGTLWIALPLPSLLSIITSKSLGFYKARVRNMSVVDSALGLRSSSQETGRKKGPAPSPPSPPETGKGALWQEVIPAHHPLLQAVQPLGGRNQNVSFPEYRHTLPHRHTRPKAETHIHTNKDMHTGTTSLPTDTGMHMSTHPNRDTHVSNSLCIQENTHRMHSSP